MTEQIISGEKEVLKTAADFVKHWQKFLAKNPLLTLDYSWPSIEVIDLLTFSSRYKKDCLLYTSPSPRDKRQSRMPSSA